MLTSMYPVDKLLYRPTLRNRLLLGPPNRHLQPAVPVSIPTVSFLPSVLVPRGLPPVSDRREHHRSAPVRCENVGSFPPSRNSLPVQPPVKNETDVTRIKSSSGELRVTSSNLNGCTYFNYYWDDKDKKVSECPCPYHSQQGRARKIERKFPNYSNLGYMAFRGGAAARPPQPQQGPYKEPEFRCEYIHERPAERYMDAIIKEMNMTRPVPETVSAVHVENSTSSPPMQETSRLCAEQHYPVQKAKEIEKTVSKIRSGYEYIRNARKYIDPELLPDVTMKHGVWCKPECHEIHGKDAHFITSEKDLGSYDSTKGQTENSWLSRTRSSSAAESGMNRKRFNLRTSRSKDERNISPVSTIRKSILASTPERKSPSKSILRTELTTAARKKSRSDLEIQPQRKQAKMGEIDNSRYDTKSVASGSSRNLGRSKIVKNETGRRKTTKIKAGTTGFEDQSSTPLKKDISVRNGDDGKPHCEPESYSAATSPFRNVSVKDINGHHYDSSCRRSLVQSDILSSSISSKSTSGNTGPASPVHLPSARHEASTGASSLHSAGPQGDELSDKIKLLKSIRLISEILEKKAILGDVGFPGLIEFSNATLQTVMTELIHLISTKTNSMKKRENQVNQESNYTQTTSLSTNQMACDKNGDVATTVSSDTQQATLGSTSSESTLSTSLSESKLSTQSCMSKENSKISETECAEGSDEGSESGRRLSNIKKELFQALGDGERILGDFRNVKRDSGAEGNGSGNHTDSIDSMDIENARFLEDLDNLDAFDFACFPFLDEIDEKDFATIDAILPDGTSDPNATEILMKMKDFHRNSSVTDEKSTSQISCSRTYASDRNNYSWRRELHATEEMTQLPVVKLKMRSESSPGNKSVRSMLHREKKKKSPINRKGSGNGNHKFSPDKTSAESGKGSRKHTIPEKIPFSLFSNNSSTSQGSNVGNSGEEDDEISKKFEDLYLYMPLKRSEIWPGLSSIYGKYETRGSADSFSKEVTSDGKETSTGVRAINRSNTGQGDEKNDDGVD